MDWSGDIEIVFSGPYISELILLVDDVPVGSVISLYFDTDHILDKNTGRIDAEWRAFLEAYDGPVTIDRQLPDEERTRVTFDEWSFRFECSVCDAEDPQDEQIEQRLQAATKGHWTTAHGVYVLGRDGTIVLEADAPADAQLAAHAKRDLRRLLDRVDELEAALEDIRGMAIDREAHTIAKIADLALEDVHE